MNVVVKYSCYAMHNYASRFQHPKAHQKTKLAYILVPFENKYHNLNSNKLFWFRTKYMQIEPSI